MEGVGDRWSIYRNHRSRHTETAAIPGTKLTSAALFRTFSCPDDQSIGLGRLRASVPAVTVLSRGGKQQSNPSHRRRESCEPATRRLASQGSQVRNWTPAFNHACRRCPFCASTPIVHTEQPDERPPGNTPAHRTPLRGFENLSNFAPAEPRCEKRTNRQILNFPGAELPCILRRSKMASLYQTRPGTID